MLSGRGKGLGFDKDICPGRIMFAIHIAIEQVYKHSTGFCGRTEIVDDE